jgi:hypothetical protein
MEGETLLPFLDSFDFLISHFKHQVETFNVKNVESVLNILVLYKGLRYGSLVWSGVGVERVELVSRQNGRISDS